MIRIILIGYMGAGKTTIGKALAKELNVPFYDLDWYITSRMRKTVAQIFEALDWALGALCGYTDVKP